MAQRLRFRQAWARKEYGDFAYVASKQQVVMSRRFGVVATLVDLVSDNGTEIQWTQGEVTRRTTLAGAGEVPVAKRFRV